MPVKPSILLIIVLLLAYISTSAQYELSLEEIKTKCKIIDPINFQSRKDVDPNLLSVDSITFRKLFSESILLGQWSKDCFYYGFKQGSNKNLSFIIIERAGHNRPYLVLTVVNKDLMLTDELMLTDHFVDAGESFDINSTIKENTIEQIKLDYNIGYEPFFKEIKSKFLITDAGKIELLEKKEELKKIK